MKMGLTFENNTIQNFDVQATFGTMNFLEVDQIFERDEENRVTDTVREQRVTVYSEKLNDQIEIAITPDYKVEGIEYDDRIELTGEVTALAWLSTYEGYNNTIQSEQAFKIRAAGIKKFGITRTVAPIKEKKES